MIKKILIIIFTTYALTVNVIASDDGELILKKIKKFRKIRLSSKKEEKSFTKNLHKIGYMKISQKRSKKDRLIIKAFQRRFRQDLVNGIVDKECFLISKNLILS